MTPASGGRGFVLAWMITAQESRTVASYRRAAVRSAVPTSSWFTNEIAAPSLSVADPDLKGITTCTTRLSS